LINNILPLKDHYIKLIVHRTSVYDAIEIDFIVFWFMMLFREYINRELRK